VKTGSVKPVEPLQVSECTEKTVKPFEVKECAVRAVEPL